MTLATDQDQHGSSASPTALRFASLRDAVMDYWEQQVRERVDAARNLAAPVLTNTLPAFFDNIAQALNSTHPRRIGSSSTNLATAHGRERALMTPYAPDHVIHEHQILRESIATLASGQVELGSKDWEVIDNSINAATRESVRAFMAIKDESRRRMAAALSHDMRTPLSVIINGAELIRVSPQGEAVGRAAAAIEASASRLGEMVGELLDALTYHGRAQIPLALAPFDILEFVTSIRDDYMRNGRDGVHIELDSQSVRGYWCRSCMRRAVENLVNNAIKYGDRGVIRIATREYRGRLMLSVHNDGNPIPESRHNLIFEYLGRDAETSSVAGWGIGLHFVRAVAESHGGSVSVDSSAETGTTFLIDVPVDCRPFVVGHHAPVE